MAQSALSPVKRFAKRVAGRIRPVILVLVIGSILICFRDYSDLYTTARVAAFLHLVGALTKWKNRKWNVFLIVAFALYSIVLTDWFDRHPLLAVLLLGGVFELLRTLLESRYRWKHVFSPGVPILVLLVSFCVTQVPNVVLYDKHSAGARTEYAYFFFRCVDYGATAGQDRVVIWQDPPPGVFPFNIRFSFCGPHTVFSFAPSPVWPTLKYKLGSMPKVKITGLRPGHGKNASEIASARKRERHGVTQFHRIYGEFQGIPRDSSQLHLRVLVMPKRRVNRLYDKITHRWFVQPHTSQGDAELRLDYDSEMDGTWYVDAFFGAPQDVGEPFEIMALVTTKDLRRGQMFSTKDVATLARVYDRLTVRRER